MTNINKVCLAGNLTKDLEVKAITEKFSIGTSTLAVNRSVKKDDKWVDETSFIDIKLLGSTAVNMQKYLTKGTRVFLEGSLVQERWEDKEGAKHSRVLVQVSNINLGGAAKAKGGDEPEPMPESTGEFQEDIPF